MERVLVAGASGLLGSTLVPTLAAYGHEVITLGRGASVGVRADLTDREQTFHALRSTRPDTVVNLVAATNVDECEKNPDGAFRGNTLPVCNIVDWITAERPSCHLVQLSTDHVYDGFGPHAESAVRLVNYYAFSKYAGEQVAARVSSTILRINFFGRSRLETRRTLSDWLVARMVAGQTTNVFQDVQFNPLSLETLSVLLSRLIERRIVGTFNLGSHGGMSKADFAFGLASTLGLSTSMLVTTQSSTAGLFARRPSDMRMNCQSFENAFDIELPTLQSEIDSMRTAYATKL